MSKRKKEVVLFLTCLTICFGVSFASRCSTPTYEMPETLLQSGETVTVTGGVGTSQVYYPHSAKWVFRTTAGNYLTVQIEVDQFNISGNACQGTQTEPFVEIGLNPGVGGYRKFCTNRVISYPLVSASNTLEIFHCNGLLGRAFQFKVTALIAGTVIADRNVGKLRVSYNQRVQWINLVAGTRDTGIAFELINVDVKRGSGKGCRRGYITVKSTDLNEETLLPNGTRIICNQPGHSHDARYKVQTRHSSVNITFRYAKFQIIYSTVPLESLSILKVPDTRSAGNGGDVDTSSENYGEGSVEVPTEATDNKSSMYKFIGIGIAGVFVILALIIAGTLLTRQRRRKRNRRESTKGLTQPGARGSMYEKVVTSQKVKRNESTRPNQKNEIMEPNEKQPMAKTHLLPMTEMDKKQQRLSQLDDKYIPFECRAFPAPPRAQFALPNQPNKGASKPNLSTRPLPESPMEFPPPPTFHNDRPPLPPPADDNRYESVGSLSDADLVAPAYATVAEDEDGSTAKLQVTNLPKDYYVSNEEIHRAELSETSHSDAYSTPRNKAKKKNQLQVAKDNSKGSELDIPLVGTDGYLCLNSNERLDATLPNKRYVSVNSASQEDIARHLKQNKAVPSPGITNVTSSLPDLLDKPEPTAQSNPVRFRRKQKLPPTIPAKSATTISNQNEDDSYNKPRPSVPDIFIQCAYASGEDISNVRNRLQKLADKAIQNQQEESESRSLLHSGATSPMPDEELPYYDSPRPSIDSSRDSLLASPGKEFYDAPRPSLPAIFPEDVTRMVNASNPSFPYFSPNWLRCI
uniref:protein Shroom-like isoform X2 n=1 Tax=Ciona intestinalis TaxID=7719 RepID=UPI000EF4A42D|nr:protein Shroom-like isoform X2 [Ciona intestinalis]|eukprot:XP_026696135.1 protein Shroom-like isoform X2 [Ciona intestinalis]